MQIKLSQTQIESENLRAEPVLSIERLVPKLNNFDNHFLLAEMPSALPGNIDLFNEAIKDWKEIENFEFQKMDVEKFFKRLL